MRLHDTCVGMTCPHGLRPHVKKLITRSPKVLRVQTVSRCSKGAHSTEFKGSNGSKGSRSSRGSKGSKGAKGFDGVPHKIKGLARFEEPCEPLMPKNLRTF